MVITMSIVNETCNLYRCELITMSNNIVRVYEMIVFYTVIIKMLVEEQNSTCRSQLVVFFLFLTSSRSVTIVSALPTKPNRHSTETSATSTNSWNVWNASTVVAGCQAAAGGHGISESIHVKLYVVLVS